MLARSLRYGAIASALGAIFAGLVFKGANDTALAGLLSAALSCALAAAVLGGERSQIETALRSALLPLGALAAFIAWVVVGAWGLAPVGFALEHPIWAETGLTFPRAGLSPTRAIEGLAAFMSAPLAFACAAFTMRSRDDAAFASRVLLFLTFAFAAYALWLHTKDLAAGYQRLSVNFGSPNVAATVFGVLCVVSLAFVLQPAPARAEARLGLAAFARAPIAASASVLCFSCLLLTASRAGIAASVGALVMFLALMALGQRRRGRTRFAFVVPFLLLMALLAVGGAFAIERLDAAGADYFLRNELREIHYQAFLERPWVGHGLNTFHEIHASHMSGDNWNALKMMGSAHNIYVQLLEETGLIGAILFALMLGPIGVRALQRSLRGPGAAWSAASVAALTLCLAHGALDFSFQAPAVAALVMFLLGASVFRVQDGEPSLRAVR